MLVAGVSVKSSVGDGCLEVELLLQVLGRAFLSLSDEVN